MWLISSCFLLCNTKWLLPLKSDYFAAAENKRERFFNRLSKTVPLPFWFSKTFALKTEVQEDNGINLHQIAFRQVSWFVCIERIWRTTCALFWQDQSVSRGCVNRPGKPTNQWHSGGAWRGITQFRLAEMKIEIWEISVWWCSIGAASEVLGGCPSVVLLSGSLLSIGVRQRLEAVD